MENFVKNIIYFAAYQKWLVNVLGISSFRSSMWFFGYFNEVYRARGNFGRCLGGRFALELLNGALASPNLGLEKPNFTVRTEKNVKIETMKIAILIASGAYGSFFSKISILEKLGKILKSNFLSKIKLIARFHYIW